MLGRGQKRAGPTGVPSPTNGTGDSQSNGSAVPTGPDPFHTMSLSASSGHSGAANHAPSVSSPATASVFVTDQIHNQNRAHRDTDQYYNANARQQKQQQHMMTARWGPEAQAPMTPSAAVSVHEMSDQGEEFDFDAFLTNIGIGSDITELLADIGDHPR